MIIPEDVLKRLMKMRREMCLVTGSRKKLVEEHKRLFDSSTIIVAFVSGRCDLAWWYVLYQYRLTNYRKWEKPQSVVNETQKIVTHDLIIDDPNDFRRIVRFKEKEQGLLAAFGAMLRG